MKMVWPLILVAVLGYWWIACRDPNPTKTTAIESVKVEEEALPNEVRTASSPVPPSENAQAISASAPTEFVVKPKEKEEDNPYHRDRFKYRKLDLPKPKTVSELMSKLTPYKDPVLPNVMPTQTGEDYDGDVTTWFSGYYELPSGLLKRIRLYRNTGGVTVWIENSKGDIGQWDQRKGELELKNFDGDPYSLIVTVSDGRVLYLKFSSRSAVEGISFPLRTMSGWLLAKKSMEAKVARVALVDCAIDEFSGDENETCGKPPPEETIRKFLPGNLPQD